MRMFAAVAAIFAIAGLAATAFVACGPMYASCDAMPACPPGTEQLEGTSECPDDSPDCFQESMCDTTIACEPCDEEPTCASGENRVDSEQDCPEYADDCYSVTACNETAWCYTPVDDCDAVPTCPLGDFEVMDEDQCPDEADDCYETTMCDFTIQCWGCDESFPECPDGSEQIAEGPQTPVDCSEDDDTRCFQIHDHLCGNNVWCEEPVETCPDSPECPEGRAKASICPDFEEHACHSESICGEWINCVDEERCEEDNSICVDDEDDEEEAGEGGD